VPVWQVPPQPLAAPQAFPAHCGAQTHVVFWHISPVGQGPEQRPPQPLSSPQLLPAQSGLHTHWPREQT
jgi:hypothetical protein